MLVHVCSATSFCTTTVSAPSTEDGLCGPNVIEACISIRSNVGRPWVHRLIREGGGASHDDRSAWHRRGGGRRKQDGSSSPFLGRPLGCRARRDTWMKGRRDAAPMVRQVLAQVWREIRRPLSGGVAPLDAANERRQRVSITHPEYPAFCNAS